MPGHLLTWHFGRAVRVARWWGRVRAIVTEGRTAHAARLVRTLATQSARVCTHADCRRSVVPQIFRAEAAAPGRRSKGDLKLVRRREGEESFSTDQFLLLLHLHYAVWE